MIEEFNKLNIKLECDLDLTQYNTMRLKSMCYVMVHPKDVQELKSIFSIVKEYKTKFFVLGNGSNVILPEYYDGVIIKLDNFKKMICDNGKIYVESGYMLNKLALKLSEAGYSGLEWATGIPGTIGGAIYSNAEAYKCPLSNLITSVIVFNGKEIIEMKTSELEFGYRTSILREESDLIVLSCNLTLKKGNIRNIKDLIQSRTKRRIETQPLNYPSCGSVFRNPEGQFAGKLIEDLGLKGCRVNDAIVSKKHANFIINDGSSSSKDVIKLIKKIKKEVKKTYNIDLVLEPEIIE